MSGHALLLLSATGHSGARVERMIREVMLTDGLEVRWSPRRAARAGRGGDAPRGAGREERDSPRGAGREERARAPPSPRRRGGEEGAGAQEEAGGASSCCFALG